MILNCSETENIDGASQGPGYIKKKSCLLASYNYKRKMPLLSKC